MQELIKRAKELLADGTVARVLGWKQGDDLPYHPEPSFFETEKDLDSFVYDDFCGANLSKYMIEAGRQEGRTLVFLKPCDTYSYNQLLKEHRAEREKSYIIGIGCRGKLDMERIRKQGIKGVRKISEENGKLRFHTIYGEKICDFADGLLERCRACRGTEHMVYDERMHPEELAFVPEDRFEKVRWLEAMTPEERFAFWQGELSKCIRCNACRNVCPVCSCNRCVFDSDRFDTAQKANSDTFEEQMFHVIRAFHVAGRCTDCGECSRVCPQGIPLHLLNRRMIKDINEFYGTFQAGADVQAGAPMTSFTLEDVEPGIVKERG